MLRGELLTYLDNLLRPGEFSDYCPNGLQVEGKPKIQRIAASVTASLEAIRHAVDFNADLLLTHHGYFWKNERPEITGIKARRLRLLLANNINLVSYHLPLDAHPELGNNAMLARVLEFTVKGEFAGIGFYGELRRPLTPDELGSHIAKKLNRAPLILSARRKISTAAWCSGAAPNLLEQASDLGFDAYLSGEVSESSYHIAREREISYFSCGHHATERYGVMALGERLAEKFGVEFKFFDCENPA